ncbi:MAG: response regulator [Candidatus Firestonebacteria bacterium]
MAKILIAEDEVDISYIIGEALKKKGHIVSFAFDGEEALKKAKQESPDMIILDIMMPKMDGFTVHQELKKDPKTKKIFILVQTAKADIKNVILVDKAYEVDGFLEKPFDLAVFFKMVEDILKSKEA